MLLVFFISLPTHLPRVRVVAPAAAPRATVPAASEGEATIAAATRIGSYPPPKDSDYVDRLCRGANGLFARTNFIPAVAEYVRLREEDGPQPLLPCASDALQSAAARRALWERLTSPPCTPGLSRPVWLVIAASVPTALGWYGYYKFSVEEELFHDELRRSGRATGCGGYGTLFPFVWSFLIGGVGLLAGLPGADLLVDAGALWILLGQVNLYRRVNELHEESGPLWTKDEALLEPPVYAWWALLPPPLDVVVGLRQVHFLARHWAAVRGEPWQGDPVAEEFFPFISAPRFTLRQFARTPALWFQFTADWEELDWPLLQDQSEGAPWRSPFEWGFLWGGAPADPAPKSIGLAPADLAAALARDLSEGRYILTGNLTSSLFADDCRFVDPNNAVDGVSRYRQALGFLFEPTRSQLDNVHVRVVAAGSGRATIEATYVASGELKLPWRPKISPWSGKISYDVSPVTGLVVAQTDVWNITRFDAIRQTFTPGSTSGR